MVEEIQHDFQFYIKDIRFHYGGVSFKHFVHSINKRLEFTIINYNIREEFDAIKDYFINIFKSKKIDVSALITNLDHGNYIIEAHSPQIESIDETILSSIKLEWTRQIISRRIILHSHTSIMTMEQFFDGLNGEDLSFPVLYNKEQELLDDILTISQSRHYYHIRYLSDKHMHHLMRLRFIIKPFSFLFLLEGISRYFLVWETLDTEEATYVWPLQKNTQTLKHTLTNLPGQLSLIKTQGKQAYQQSSSNDFIRIVHQYKHPAKGFILWKNELETHLHF
jgi:hypothetical protein